MAAASNSTFVSVEEIGAYSCARVTRADRYSCHPARFKTSRPPLDLANRSLLTTAMPRVERSLRPSTGPPRRIRSPSRRQPPSRPRQRPPAETRTTRSAHDSTAARHPAPTPKKSRQRSPRPPPSVRTPPARFPLARTLKRRMPTQSYDNRPIEVGQRRIARPSAGRAGGAVCSLRGGRQRERRS